MTNTVCVQCNSIVDRVRVCDRCRKRRRQHRGACTGCAKPDRLLDDNALCRWCREKAQQSCPRCPSVGQPLTTMDGERMCARCALRCHLEHVLPPTANGLLEPLRDAILQAEPKTTRRWLNRNTDLLRGLHDGTIPLTHAALDLLPRPKSVDYLRSLLIATGILDPDAHRSLRRLETELPQLLSGLGSGHHNRASQWTHWAVLPRLRGLESHRPIGTAVQNARCQILQVIEFLNTLEQREIEMHRCEQHAIDAWFAEPGTSRWHVRPFLTWARRTRHLPKEIDLPKGRRVHAELPTDAEDRWQIGRRLVKDESLDPVDRLAGALVALYAQSLRRIVSLTTADVIATATTTGLRLGATDVLVLPDPFAAIARTLPLSRRTGTVEQLPTTWLFAGGHAGKPLTATSLGNRLRAIGIEPRKLRLSATEQLARELPPSVLAGILGLNAHTVAQHTLKTNGQWANYAANRRS